MFEASLRFLTCISPQLRIPILVRAGVVVLSLLLLCVAARSADQKNQLQQQFGATQNFTIDSIDLTSLTVDFNVPLLQKTGRGENLNLRLAYSATSILASYYGWTTPLENLVGRGTYSIIGCSNVGCGYKFYWVDPYGVNHEWTVGSNKNGWDCTGSGVSCSSNDGSNLTLSPSTGTGTITASDGASWSVIFTKGGFSPGGYAADSNGNQITETATTIEDTLGGTLQVQNFSPLINRTNITTYGGVESGTPPPAETYSYIDSSGSPHQVAINYELATLDNIIPASPCAKVHQTVGTSPGLTNLPSSVSFPNGTAYSFIYEVSSNAANMTTARVSQLRLPTGGYISYNYPSAASLIHGTQACLDSGVFFLNRTTTDGTWTYTRALSNYEVNDPTLETTTVVDPKGNTTVYTFFFYRLSGGEGSTYFLTSKAVYQGGATGTPLLYQQVCYNGFSPPCASETAQNLPSTDHIVSTKDVYTSYNGGPSSRTTTTYGWPLYVPTEVDEYDFGASTPVRKTFTTYYTMNGLMSNKPSSVVVEDGGNNILQQSKYGYDETGAVGTTGVPQHLTVPAQRGNITSESVWSKSDGTWFTTTYTNDDTGNRLSATDPKGNPPTKYSYTDSWYSNESVCNVTNTNAFLTQTTDALGHISKSAYDACTGLKRQDQDPNDLAASRAGTITSYDLMSNQTGVQYSDGGSDSTSYGGYAVPLTITKTTLATPDPSVVTATVKDGYGRTVREETTSDPTGIIYTDTTYDGSGHFQSTSNPYRSTSDATYGITSYLYDALGRKTYQCQPDNSTTNTTACTPQNSYQSWSYNGNTVTFKDEIGNQWQRTSDALGRLTKVLEPSAISPTPTLETDYQYDALNNLTRVDQWGGPKGNTGDRVRTFTYDSLSRLITSSNPETGTICYGQGSGSSCVNGYDANGNLLWKTDARSITTSYSYDALNRLTQKTYSDGTPAAHFIYDASTADFGQGAIVATPLSIGRLSSQYVGNSPRDVAVKSFSYDSMGRENGDTQCWGTECSMANGLLTTDHQYDLAGNVVVLGNSTQSWYNFNYDGAGRLKSVDYTLHDWTAGTFPTWNLANSATYTAGGQLLTLDGSQIWTYDNRMRAHSYQLKWGWVQPDVIKYGYTLTPLANGNIQTQVETTPQGTTTWQYTYDNLNRLSTTVNSALQTGCQENYDNWGNRTSQVAYGGSGYSCTQPITPSSGTSNRIDGYCYDAAGNVLNEGPCSSGAQKYAYDAENRLISSEYGANTYAYGADGQRVTKVSSEGTFHYVRDLDGSVMVDYKDNSAYGQGQYSKFNGQTLARISNYDTTASTDITWSFNDWLGTTRLRLAMNGLIPPRGEYSSLPFGDALTTTAGGDGDPHHFTGKERDTESGLDYFGARYYSSNMGRFSSPDPSGLVFADPTNPQSFNLYGYVMNNPLINVDPNGLDCIHVNNDTGAYEGFERGDCDNSTEDKANTGRYIDGTVNTIYTSTGDTSGIVGGYSGTKDDGSGTLISGTFASGISQPVDMMSMSQDDRIQQLAIGITADSQHSFGCIAQAYGIGGPSAASGTVGSNIFDASQNLVGKAKAAGAAGSTTFTSEAAMAARASSLGSVKLGFNFPTPVGTPFSGNFAMRGSGTLGGVAGRYAPYAGAGMKVAGVAGTAYSSYKLYNCLGGH